MGSIGDKGILIRSTEDERLYRAKRKKRHTEEDMYKDNKSQKQDRHTERRQIKRKKSLRLIIHIVGSIL